MSTLEPQRIAAFLDSSGSVACGNCAKPLGIDETVCIVDVESQSLLCFLGSPLDRQALDRAIAASPSGEAAIPTAEVVLTRTEVRSWLASLCGTELQLLGRAMSGESERSATHHELLTARCFAFAWLACLTALPSVELRVDPATTASRETLAVEVIPALARLQASSWLGFVDGETLDAKLDRSLSPGAVLPGAPQKFAEDYAALADGLSWSVKYALLSIAGELTSYGRPVGLLDDWVAMYVQFELANATGDGFSRDAARLRLGPARAKRIVPCSEFFDFAVALVNDVQRRDTKAESQEGDEYEAVMTGLLSLADRIEFQQFPKQLLDALRLQFAPSTNTHEALMGLAGNAEVGPVLLQLASQVLESFPYADRASAAIEFATKFDEGGRTPSQIAEVNTWLGKTLHRYHAHSRFLDRVGVEPTTPEADLVPSDWAPLQFERAKALRYTGRVEEAASLVTHIVKVAQAAGVSPGTLQPVLLEEASLVRELGDPERAEQLIRRIGPIEDVEGQVFSLINEANIAMQRRDWARASTLLEDGLELATGPYRAYATRIRVQQAQVLASAGLVEEAVEELGEVSATQVEDPVIALLTLGAFINLSGHGELLLPLKQLLEGAVSTAEHVLEQRSTFPPDVVRETAKALGILADAADADSRRFWLLASSAGRDPSRGGDPEALVRLAGFDLAEGRFAQFRERVEEAHGSVVRRFVKTRSLGVMAEASATFAGAVHHLGELASDVSADPQARRVIADLGRDLVGRARATRGLGKLPWDEEVSRCLGERSAVLEFWECGDYLQPVMTHRSDGAVVSSVLPWPLSVDLLAVGTRLRMRLSVWHAGRNGDPFDNPGWLEVCQWLREAVRGVGEFERLFIISNGAVADIPWHVALADEYVVQYAPSWGVILAGERRDVVPSSLTVIIVPRQGESAVVTGAMKAAAERLGTAARRAGVTVRLVEGAEADRAAVKSALETSDAVLMLCHGLIDAEGNIAWMVAHDGALPLVDSISAAQPLGERHRFGWKECDALQRSPAVVLSAACSSGRARFSGSGEVVGLYSMLRATGTRVLVAPQWDIEPGEALPVLSLALDRWLSGVALPDALSVSCGELRSSCAARHLWAFAAEGEGQ